MTMTQSLGHTVDAEKQTIIVLDARRKQYNEANSSGDVMPDFAWVNWVLQSWELLLMMGVAGFDPRKTLRHTQAVACFKLMLLKNSMLY